MRPAVIDPTTLRTEVLGAAQVTLHHSGRGWAYSKGQSFNLNEGQREAGSTLQAPEPTPDIPEEEEHFDIAQARTVTQQAMENGNYPTAVQGLQSTWGCGGPIWNRVYITVPD